MGTGHTTVVVSHAGGMATIVNDGEVRRVMAGAMRPSVVEYDRSLIACRVLRVYKE